MAARSALWGAVAAVVLLLVPAVGTTGSGGPAARPAAAVSVSIRDNFYRPTTRTVRPRTTVTWTNNGGNRHSATANSGRFDTRILDPGESRSVTFRRLGTYRYFCQIHSGMTGVIRVCKMRDGVRVCRPSS